MPNAEPREVWNGMEPKVHEFSDQKGEGISCYSNVMENYSLWAIFLQFGSRGSIRMKNVHLK